MSSVLDTIVSRKLEEISGARQRVSQRELERKLPGAPAVRDFAAALRASASPALIAEIKKASPSAGVIKADFDPVALAQAYARHGAACLSVLTDTPFFQGRLEDLEAVRAAAPLPVLRKDFILDEYQVVEARVAGADAVLLIAECLEGRRLADLHQAIVGLGMRALVELYDEVHLDRVLALKPTLVGVNNRDLRTFSTNLDHALRLRPRVPADVLFVAESGIRTAADVARLQAAGVNAMLVGESLMRSPDTGAAVDQLLADRRLR